MDQLELIAEKWARLQRQRGSPDAAARAIVGSLAEEGDSLADIAEIACSLLEEGRGRDDVTGMAGMAGAILAACRAQAN